MKYHIAIFLCLFVSTICAQENVLPSPSQAYIDSRVEEILAKMTLAEKIGQMTLYTADYGADGPSLRPEYIQGIRDGKIGAIFNALTAEFTAKLQKIAVEETSLKIPLLFGYDVVHGFKTIFPIPLGEAASWDVSAIEMSARIAAREAASAGIHWTFAPMVDICRDPRWGRIAEGAGEDPYLGSVIARARVRGFQGKNLAADDTILACAKHFAAYGAAEAGRDYNTVDISEHTLREIYLPPFKAAIDAGAATIMTAFNELNGIPCTGNRYLLTNILRSEWQFKGFVVTDYTSINEMLPHGIVANPTEAAKLAAEVGVDMDMQGGIFQGELARLVAGRRLPLAIVDNAVRRILRLKFRLGLFDNPYAYCNLRNQQRRIMTWSHLRTALQVAQRSIVLLKNTHKLLPLSKGIKTIALIGPLADNKADLLGSWCAAGDAREVVTLRTGIDRVVTPATKVLYAKGCDIDGKSTAGFAEAVALAQKADVIIAAMGESAGMSGEAASRSDLNLPGVQRQLLQELHRTGKPIVLVLMNGRPLTLPWEQQELSAILECWFLGTQAGAAIASVIFGDYNPSGRLPVTFPRNIGQVPLYYNYKNTGRPIEPGNKYTSQYLDVENTPLYPFGFGLSYTTFAYSNLQLSKNMLSPKENLRVTVDVTNSGLCAGTETVQLYIRDEVGSVTRPVKELRGFKQISLAPGETRTVSFTLTPRALSCYDRSMQWTVEPGFFLVMVGSPANGIWTERFEVK